MPIFSFIRVFSTTTLTLKSILGQRPPSSGIRIPSTFPTTAAAAAGHRVLGPISLISYRMVGYAEKPLVGPFTAEEWEAFLSNDPPRDGVRLLLRKANSTAPGIAYPDALDLALCYGWIDSQGGKHDEDYRATAFTPRRARSRWSQVNRDHVERLLAQGRMREAGLVEVERARADGRWEAAYRMKTAEPDAAFQAALDAHPRAKAFWESLGRTRRFPFLFRLMDIKRPETKTKRITSFIEILERGETL